MFLLPISLTTAAAAGLLNFWLGYRVGQVRGAEKISIGDGGNLRLIARMRAQLNFAEYTPIVLILLALVELARGGSIYLWVIAMLFIVGRVLHAFGMDGWMLGRAIGIGSTMLITLGLAVYAALLAYKIF
ncbi:MAG: MAPEG family protein [Pseudomonadota bacterium]